MKMSTGGLGTVATAQACNAKSAYPYQWAWNAVGTDVSSTGDWESGNIITQLNSTVESDPYGIKCSPSVTTLQSYTAYNDEGLATPGGKVGGNRSGPLNGVDIRQAQYVHCVVDLLSGNKTGWADTLAGGSILENFTDSWDAGNEDAGGWNDGLFSYEIGTLTGGTGATSVAGGVAIFPHSLNANTFILVWDPLTQIHKQGPPEGGGAFSEWGPDSPFPFTDPEKPFRLSLYTGGPFANDTENYIIIMGWVIADRILSDIPLPIRTHMG